MENHDIKYGKLISMAAIIYIFAGFALIIFSIISFDNIAIIACCFIPATSLIIYGFLIFTRFIRALKYYNIYMTGAVLLEEYSDILMDSKRNIRKDIEKMAYYGVMPNAHFDENNILVFTQDYDKSKVIDVEISETNINTPVVTPNIDKYYAKEWRKYITEINAAENEFKSQDISFSLYRLGKAVGNVIDYLEKHPEKEKDVKKLMEFHLPSTIKLIASYKELDKSGLNTFNIEKTKEEIVSACDKIHEAFSGVLEDLYNDKAIDVSADIQVLQIMLSREGFLDRDIFRKK